MNEKLIRAWQKITKGPPPIVFINGKAKVNPTVQEIVAEYNNSGED